MLHIKRFIDGSSKILTPLAGSWLEFPALGELHSCQYNLSAAICHIGKSPVEGHYFSIVRRIGSRECYKFDDASVSMVDEAAFHRLVRGQGYLLFYRRSSQ